MITVLQLVKQLGIAYSPLVLSVLGVYVKQRMSRYVHIISKTKQEENGEWLIVNCYHDTERERIKIIIEEFLKSKKQDWQLLQDSRMYKIDNSSRWQHVLKRVR